MMGGEAVLDRGVVVRGELRCDGDLIVRGRVEGTVVCGGALRLEAEGVLEAEVQARRAILAGQVRGNVSAPEEVELTSSCRMIGDLRAGRIVLQAGAAVRGRVEMGWLGEEDAAAAPTEVDAPAEEAAPAEAESAAGDPPEEEPSGAAAEPAATAPPDDAAADVAIRPPPPPMPASALALGVRSHLVLKPEA